MVQPTIFQVSPLTIQIQSLTNQIQTDLFQKQQLTIKMKYEIGIGISMLFKVTLALLGYISL
jgi:hypothetical protein